MSDESVLQGTPKQDLVFTRVLDAPVERVWKAWTDCGQLMRWWGPRGFSSPSCRIDLREGGRYLFHMRASPEFGGQDYYSTGVYKEVVPLERLEFGQSLSDKEGNPIDPAQAGMPPDFPPETRTLLIFKRLGERTELTVTEYAWPLGRMRDLSETGMNESLDKLAECLRAPESREREG